jgi:hypothetical protein
MVIVLTFLTMVTDLEGSVVVTKTSKNVAQYKADKPGIIYVTDNTNPSSHACDVYINGKLVSQFQDPGGHVGAHTYVIASGDVIKFDCTRMGTIYFVDEPTDPSDVSDIPGDSMYILFVPFKTV